MGKNCDVLFAICPCVFMVEAQSVKNLMDDVTHDARGPNKHGLLTADEAHIWRTTKTWQLMHSQNKEDFMLNISETFRAEKICWSTEKLCAAILIID